MRVGGLPANACDPFFNPIFRPTRLANNRCQWSSLVLSYEEVAPRGARVVRRMAIIHYDERRGGLCQLTS